MQAIFIRSELSERKVWYCIICILVTRYVHFLKSLRVSHNLDTFGYSAQLPQIIKSAGLEYFFTQKLSWNNINKFPHTSFYWTGLDGTSVLTHFSPADTYTAQASVRDAVFMVFRFIAASYLFLGEK